MIGTVTIEIAGMRNASVTARPRLPPCLAPAERTSIGTPGLIAISSTPVAIASSKWKSRTSRMPSSGTTMKFASKALMISR